MKRFLKFLWNVFSNDNFKMSSETYPCWKILFYERFSKILAKSNLLRQHLAFGETNPL